MSERHCTHVFAPCDGPCTSYVYSAEEIDHAARRVGDRWEFIAYLLPLSVAIVFGGAAIISQGVANWKAEQHRQISQARV